MLCNEVRLGKKTISVTGISNLVKTIVRSDVEEDMNDGWETFVNSSEITSKVYKEMKYLKEF